MITRAQTLAGATPFTGMAAAGLFDFLDLPLQGDSEDQVPVIVGIAYDNDAAEQIEVNCFLKPPGDALTTTRRYNVYRETATIGFSKMGCYIPVPRTLVGVAGFVPWQAILITTGKAATGSFVISYRVGAAGGNVP